MKKSIARCALAFLLIAGCGEKPIPGGSSPGTYFAIFLTNPDSNTKKMEKVDLVKNIIRIADGGDTIVVYAGDSGTTIGTFQLPKVKLSDVAKEEIFNVSKASLVSAIDAVPPDGAGGSLNITAITRRLSADREKHPNAHIKIVLYGSPWPTAAGERSSRAIPPDAAFCSVNSPYFVKAGSLSGQVHFFYTSNDELMKGRCQYDLVKRWWAKYFGAQGAEVLTFSADLKDYDRLGIQGLAAEKVTIDCAKTTVDSCDTPVFDIQSLSPPPPPSAPASPAPKRRHSPTPKHHTVPKQPDKKVDCPCFGKR